MRLKLACSRSFSSRRATWPTSVTWRHRFSACARAKVEHRLVLGGPRRVEGPIHPRGREQPIEEHQHQGELGQVDGLQDLADPTPDGRRVEEEGDVGPQFPRQAAQARSSAARTARLGERLRSGQERGRRVGAAAPRPAPTGMPLWMSHPPAEGPAGVALERSQRLSRQVGLPGRALHSTWRLPGCAPPVSLERELELVVDVDRREDGEDLVKARLVPGSDQQAQVDLGRGALRDASMAPSSSLLDGPPTAMPAPRPSSPCCPTGRPTTALTGHDRPYAGDQPARPPRSTWEFAPDDDPRIEPLARPDARPCRRRWPLPDVRGRTRRRRAPWGALLCDTHAILDCCCAYGEGRRPARAACARDLPSPICVRPSKGSPGPAAPRQAFTWRGQGRVTECCPQTTLEALPRLQQAPVRTDGRRRSLRQHDTALRVWRGRSAREPYMFGHGRRAVQAGQVAAHLVRRLRGSRHPRPAAGVVGQT